MSTIYYYVGVSGRTRFVTFNKQGAYYWTNEKSPVKKESISDLKRFAYLKGKTVSLNGYVGKITGCNPTDSFLAGKYAGDNKYSPHPELLNTNHLVSVHWLNGVLPTWVPFYKLKLQFS